MNKKPATVVDFGLANLASEHGVPVPRTNGNAGEPAVPYRLDGPDEFRKVKRPRFVIPGLVPEGGTFLLFSPSGHYKTTTALLAFVLAANGRALDGSEIEPTPLVIAANEDPKGVKVRLIALADHMGLSLADVRVLGEGERFFLDLEESRDRLVAAARLAYPGRRANLVIDHYDVSLTLNPTDPETGGIARDAMRSLVEGAFASATLLAHTPWSTNDRAKLPVSLWANMDARGRLQKREDGTAELYIEHVKNAESGYALSLALETVTADLDVGPFDTVLAKLATDDEGALRRDRKQRKERKQKRSDDQKTAIKAIARAVVEHPAAAPPSNDIPRGVAGTSETAAIDMIARLVPRTTKGGKERDNGAQRCHAARVLLSLHARWDARIVDGFVFLPKGGSP